jgi:hypothetical protein
MRYSMKLWKSALMGLEVDYLYFGATVTSQESPVIKANG